MGPAAGRGGLEGRAALQHPHVGKGGHVLGDGVGQLEAPLLVQHHGRHRGDGLGHGEDAKDAVVLDRQPRLQVAPALLGAVDHLAAAADLHLPAGQAPVVDVGGKVRPDAGQAGRIETLDGRHAVSL
jgi:hypothetical protein